MMKEREGISTGNGSFLSFMFPNLGKFHSVAVSCVFMLSPRRRSGDGT